MLLDNLVVADEKPSRKIHWKILVTVLALSSVACVFGIRIGTASNGNPIEVQGCH